jgi:hypothetical protein
MDRDENDKIVIQYSPGLYDLYCITNTITLYSNVQGLLINLSFSRRPPSPPYTLRPHFALHTPHPSLLARSASLTSRSALLAALGGGR